MKLLLLDRNAVSYIRSYQENKKLPKGVLEKLRVLDKKSNTISPMLSVIEGRFAKRQTVEEVLNTLKLEAKTLSSFFRKAKTDSRHLTAMSERISDVIGNNIEHKFDSYISFVKKALQLLLQPVGKSQKRKFEQIIIDEAKQHQIPLGHGVCICCLSLLYDGKSARKILKPKESMTIEELNKAAYNAVCDILLIPRIEHIRAIVEKTDSASSRVRFFTFDKGLHSFLNNKNVENKQLMDEGGVFLTTSYSKSLFPDLDEDGYFILMEELKQ